MLRDTKLPTPNNIVNFPPLFISFRIDRITPCILTRIYDKFLACTDEWQKMSSDACDFVYTG